MFFSEVLFSEENMRYREVYRTDNTVRTQLSVKCVLAVNLTAFFVLYQNLQVVYRSVKLESTYCKITIFVKIRLTLSDMFSISRVQKINNRLPDGGEPQTKTLPHGYLRTIIFSE